MSYLEQRNNIICLCIETCKGVRNTKVKHNSLQLLVLLYLNIVNWVEEVKIWRDVTSRHSCGGLMMITY